MPIIRVVIVDDESPARRKLQRLLTDEPDFTVVGEAGTGLEAVGVIQREQPDLLFLDIQMPGLNGFEVIRALDLDPLPQIVFTTAFDQFAIRAFEVHALDYLLKPFDHSRFKSVLARVRQLLRRNREDGLSDKVAMLLAELAGRERFPERLLVNAGDRALLLPIGQISFIEAAKNYVQISAGGQSYLLRGTLEALYQKLDPAKFIRANRSQVVNVESIKELQPWFHGEYKIILKNGKEVTWSRRYVDKNSDLILKRI